MPKVSIILPSFNHRQFLEQRLASIMHQTFQDFEMIIIDDCSSDGSLQLLERFEKENKTKVKCLISNETNSGSGYSSWQKGIEMATSEFIWIAETDDYSDPEFLEHSVAVLEQYKDAALVFCTSRYVDDKGAFLYDSQKRTSRLGVQEGASKVFESKVLVEDLPFNTLITNGSSVVFRNSKKSLPKELFWQRQSSDLFLWTHLLNNKKFVFLNMPLNYFRRHEDSTTSKLSLEHSRLRYAERATYINYFNVPEKHVEFLRHYINYYSNANKRSILDFRIIDTLDNGSGLRIKYIKLLVDFYLKKLKLRK